MSNTFTTEFMMISNPGTILFLLGLFLMFGVIHYLYKKKQWNFSLIVMIGTLLGLLLGFLMQVAASFPSAPLDITFIKETTTWYALFGNGYIDLIKMLVVPLVIVSILQVIIHMKHGKTMGKLIKTTIVITMTMVAVSSIVGIVVATIFQLGAGTTPITDSTAAAKEITSVAETLRGLIPSNIVSAMVNNNIIGLVIFASLLGTAIWYVNLEYPDIAKPLYTGITALHKAMINMSLLILDFMPYAVIALLANTIATRGLRSIIDAGMFILALYVAVAVQFIIQLIALALFGIHPIHYLRKSCSTMLLAFTSRSSVGCLPSTIHTLTNQLGVEESTANFVAGFGTTAGMQGCAGIFPSMLIIYVANLTGTPINVTLIAMTVIVVTIGSLGIAGIPGTATMSASVGLSGVGMASYFPLISPILSIDPIIDMGRTFLNVTGSMTNALLVDKKLGTLRMNDYAAHNTTLEEIM